MNATRFGLILKVNDLDACRIFYRDLLQLGEPVLDSTFAVVYPADPDTHFRLRICSRMKCEIS